MSGSASGSGNSSATLGQGGGQAQTDTTTSAQIQVVSAGSFEIELSVDSTEIDSIAEGQTVTITEAESSSTTGTFGPGGDSPVVAAFRGAVASRESRPPRVAATRQFSRPDGDGTSDDGDDTAEDGTDDGPTIASDAVTATGEVVEVDRIADASSGVAIYAVTVGFDDTDGNFFIGTSVVADVVTSERKGVTQIPLTALASSQDGASVTLAVDGTTRGRHRDANGVDRGDLRQAMIEITDGLQPGDRVIAERVVAGPGGGRTLDGGNLPTDGEFPTDGQFPGSGFPGDAPGTAGN